MASTIPRAEYATTATRTRSIAIENPARAIRSFDPDRFGGWGLGSGHWLISEPGEGERKPSSVFVFIMVILKLLRCCLFDSGYRQKVPGG
jgi:hypothetical protein